MEMDHVFQDAGLMDSSGKITSEPNFGATPEPDRDAFDWSDLDSELTPAEDKAPETETPAAPAPAANFDVAPQLKTTVTPQQAEFVGRTQIERQYNEALIYGQSLRDAEGKPLYSLAELQSQLAPMRQAMEAQLQADVVKHQMAPYAARMAADHIAKQYGVKVEDILDGSSPEVMEDRARTIARFQRDTKFADRAAAKVDVVEGGRGMSNTASEAYEKLSPSQKIKFGLMRGDR